MTNAGKGPNLQDIYLNQLRKDRTPVVIYLTNGVRLKGVIKGFDNFVVLLKENTFALVYKKNRFEPAHALAMSLKSDQVQRRLDLKSDDPRLQAYLHGDSIACEIAPGWALVTIDGYALGWVKVTQGIAKNFYPRGLRRPS